VTSVECKAGLACEFSACQGPGEYTIRAQFIATPGIWPNGPPAAVVQVVSDAVAEWRKVIQGKLRPLGLILDKACDDPNWTPTTHNLAGTDLIIYWRGNIIDGRGGTLAQAKYCLLDDDGFPRLGTFEVDAEDPPADKFVVMHEMGHILGFSGNLNDRLTPALFTPDYTYFIGPSASQAWKEIGGGSQGVPIMRDWNDEKKAYQFGGHWDETKLNCELMTPAKDNPLFNPDAILFLSKMTVGFFQDYGYNVAMCAGRKMNMDVDIQCPVNLLA